MTVLCFDWESAHRCGEARLSQHRLRYELFVRRQGWDVPHHNGLEYDQFDTPAAKYIVRLDTDSRACGETRLLPTTRPYMIRTIWPQLVNHCFEEGESIWEATRFGVARAIPARPPPQGGARTDRRLPSLRPAPWHQALPLRHAAEDL